MVSWFNALPWFDPAADRFKRDMERYQYERDKASDQPADAKDLGNQQDDAWRELAGL